MARLHSWFFLQTTPLFQLLFWQNNFWLSQFIPRLICSHSRRKAEHKEILLIYSTFVAAEHFGWAGLELLYQNQHGGNNRFARFFPCFLLLNCILSQIIIWDEMNGFIHLLPLCLNAFNWAIVFIYQSLVRFVQAMDLTQGPVQCW